MLLTVNPYGAQMNIEFPDDRSEVDMLESLNVSITEECQVHGID